MKRTLFMLMFVAMLAARLEAQSLAVSKVGDQVHIRPQGFGFIKGEPLDRLKHGQQVRFDFELIVLSKPGGTVVTGRRQSFNVSYDLWEERFASTRLGDAPRSISHLTSTAAEAWCLEQLTTPVSSFGRLGPDTPFWIRLQYRVPDRDRAPTSEDGSTFTLRTLIDMLSGPRKGGGIADSLEGGPFRLSD